MENTAEQMRLRRRMLAVPIVYFFVYMGCFLLLENFVQPRYWISSSLDAYIPFFEGFLIPYILWFPMVPLVFYYFWRRDPQSYLQLCRVILTGLTVCLILYALFPNGQLLRRPLSRDNLLCKAVELIRMTDTPTNVCPSIHVFVSNSVALAVARAPSFRDRRRAKTGIIVLSILICMSTVFLKQHSIVDVACGAALGLSLDALYRKVIPAVLPGLLEPRRKRILES